MVTCKVVALIIAFLVRLRKVTMSVQHSKKGTGKTRNEKMEMGNGDEKWEFSFITALHALLAFSNTFWSRLLPQEIAERK